MCKGTDSDLCPDEPEDPTVHPIDASVESEQKHSIARRTFLKAAALGTATAALIGKSGGVHLGPLSALAHDMSGEQCTANDVRIVGGLGQIINEPCDCSGTFNATVQFTVENNAASERGCITLHLAGGPFNVPDIILNGGAAIPGKTTQTMTGTIANFPCGAGLVCFGLPGEEIRGRCGAPCSTVSWTVPGQDTCPPTRFISSKCRHQQICIQGRGGATLDCDPSTTAVDTNCSVPCGGTATLRLCTNSPAAFGPFTFTLSDGQTFGPTSDTCHDFTVGPLAGNASFTGSITDNTGCTRSASVNLTVAAIAKPVVSAGTPDCDGNVDYSVDNCDGSLSYTWQEVDCGTGAPVGDLPGSGCNLSVQWPKGTTHCVVVTASNGQTSCDQTSDPVSVTIPSQVVLTLAEPTSGCDGVVTFTATATGGTPPYTFTWRVNDVDQSETGNVFTVQPLLNGTCRKIQVKAVDSNGCESDGARTKGISQCVETVECDPF